MNPAPKDINSLVKLIKTYHSRVVSLQDKTLTSSQLQQAEVRLKHSLANEGVAYSFGHYDDPGKMSFSFEPLYIRDFGAITDVRPVGSYPIILSVGENVTVAFEPRDLTGVDRFQTLKLNNARFADLRKGSSFEFAGWVNGCGCYFDRPYGDTFSFSVRSDLRSPMSVIDWIRKLWNGRMPGIDFVR